MDAPPALTVTIADVQMVQRLHTLEGDKSMHRPRSGAS
jgi:hypothetical protein